MTSKVYLLALLFAVALTLGHGSLIRKNDFSDEIFDNLNELEFTDKPTDHAKVAREVVHKAEWTAFGTISTMKSITGFPMVNVISVADSKFGSPSTGHIYFYLTTLDYTANDLMKDNKATLLYSADQDLSCSMQTIDSMEPTCARIMISGKVKKLVNGTEEYEFGAAAFLSRHPAVVNWTRTHSFFLCTLEIAQVVVLDWYGGPHLVPVNEYYKSTTDAVVRSKSWNNVETHYGTKSEDVLAETNDVTKFEDVHQRQHGRHHLKIKINSKRDEIDIEI